MASPEPKGGAGLAGALVLVAALVAGIALIEWLVSQTYRQAAMRLVAATVLLLAVFRIRALVRTCIGRPAAWGGDGAGGDAWSARASDSRFERLHEEIRFSARSQPYFEHLLWPRLVAFARGARGSTGGLDKPPGRRLGRGPSLEAIARLIASLEGRR